MLQKYKYGTDDIYEKIRTEIKKSPLFRFDWFIKSRSASVRRHVKRCSLIF